MEFIIRHKSIVVFVFLSLFCLVSLSLKSTSMTMSVEGVGSIIVMPFQKGYHAVQQSVHMLWAGFTELRQVRDELRKTREKLQKYEGMAEELGEINKENQRLRQLLDMQGKVTYESIPATIISKDPDNWFRTIIVNRGSVDGVTEDMPVIAFNGEEKAVVGRITEVRRNISRIMPIISNDMKMGVMFQESRFPGLLTGYSSSSNLSLVDYISKSAMVKFGDVIITSGQGGIFPQGLLVGKVLKSFVTESSAYLKAVVKPIIDFNQVEEVYIIKKAPDKEMMELFGEEHQ